MYVIHTSVRSVLLFDTLACSEWFVSGLQERTQGEGLGLGHGPSLLDLPSTGFSGFLPLNYVICIFAACVRNCFAMLEDRASLQHCCGLSLG